MSTDLIDAVTGAWALASAHLEGRDEDRAILLGGDLPADYWRPVANHLAEQLAFRLRHEFDDARASELVGRVRRAVLAGCGGGGQRPEADR